MHLDFRPKSVGSQKGRLRNGETAWPGELKDTVFWPALGWSSMSNVASRTYKKEMLLQLWGSFRTSNWLWDAPRLPTQKRSQKGRLRNGETAWPGELKDTVFWPALGWSSMSNVASRTYKKEMLLQLWGSFRTSNWLWDAPRLPTQKRSQKGRLRNGETAWPGELKDTVFWPALGWSSMSNVASRTYKKEMLLQLWGSFRTSNWLWDAPRLPTQKRSQKGRLRNGETAWPGELKDTVFWPALGWSSMSNVASRTYIKKRCFCSFGTHFAPRIGFEMHLDFRPKSVPKKAGSGTGKQRGLASSRTPFFDMRWGDLQCQTSRPEPIKKRCFCSWGSFRTSNQHGLASSRTWGDLQCQTSRPEPIKKRCFCSFGAHFAPRIGFEMHLDFGPKSVPKKAGSGTGKQHGLASSRTWGDLQCQTSRPEPIKKRCFCSFGAHFAPRIGFEMHLDFRPKSVPKKAGSGTGKQHGLASSRTPFFDLRWGDLQCQTSRPEPI